MAAERERKMRKTIILAGAAISLAGCGQSSGNEQADKGAVNNAAAAKPTPAYCFFKDSETKAWKATVDKAGNVLVSGKAYREDARYKAFLSPATVQGTSAEVAPTIGQNDTGFASPDNWWDVTETIPNSQAVTTVNVKCGEKTLASLTVPRKK
jgi:hypothetical protein